LGGKEALVAADNGAIIAPGQHRLYEAELADAPFVGVKLRVADSSWVLGDRVGAGRSKRARP
jgi:hypothetical protein